MTPITLNGSTIPYSVTTKFRASKVLLRPAQPGAGIKAGGAVRAVMEALGVKDVVAKALGSRNPINVVQATIQGLRHMETLSPREDEQARKAVLPAAPDRRTPLRRKRVPAAIETGATVSAVTRRHARPRFRSVTDGETAYQVGAERHRL